MAAEGIEITWETDPWYPDRCGNFSVKMNHIFLAHLSKNTNTQEMALQTMQSKLSGKGIILNNRLYISSEA